MKTKLVTVVSAVTMSWLALFLTDMAVAQRSENYRPQATNTTSASQPSQQQGAGGAIVATQITPQEAAKKYPPPKGGAYPTGERDPHKASGIVSSPYPPHTVFDCSKVPHNGLVLDTRVQKVFVRP